MIRRIVWLVLILLSFWLYWQNVTLVQENQKLRANLAAADKKLARLHQKAPAVKFVSASAPIEAAQQHLIFAQNAFLRRDYATALHELDLAEAQASKAATSASRQTRAAATELSVRLKALRDQIGKAPGPWSKSSTPHALKAGG
ncbi:MAG: hypothetical protein P4L33_06925 [Capsulimonadaceae bacterium]|nr:hypothetical protein [Capsulimonadaceae bacterium]